jgi:uncharacterized protein
MKNAMNNTKISRRSFLRRFTYSVLGFLGLSSGAYFYSKHLEPSMLNIKREKIYSPKVPNSFENKKILQFGDTHLGFHYDLDQLEKLVKTMNDLNPDIVVFTGDLVDNPETYTYGDFEKCAAILSKIQAPLGKFWIYGNHDHGGYGTETLKVIMNLGGFQLLQNESMIISQGNDRINLIGMDDVLLGRPDLHMAIQNVNFNYLTIMLCHEPDYADYIVEFPIDIQFSGHSHGGQIRIPFVGSLITPTLADKYVDGKYTLGNQPLQLFVSRGIGTTRLPYRFLCKPEINLYTLHHGQAE